MDEKPVHFLGRAWWKDHIISRIDLIKDNENMISSLNCVQRETDANSFKKLKQIFYLVDLEKERPICSKKNQEY